MGDLRDGQLQLLWNARVDYDADSGVDTHQHSDYHQLLLVLSGSGTVEVEEKDYPVEGGGIYILKRGASHKFIFTEAAATLDFKFRVSHSGLEEIIDSIGPAVKCPELEREELKKWHRLAQVHFPESGNTVLARIDAGFKSTLLSLHAADCGKNSPIPVPEYTQPDSWHVSGVQSQHAAVLFIERNYDGEITLDQLAKRFNYNPNYIIKIFQEEVGMAPIQYLREVRFRYACYYLEYTGMRISDIAFQVGMSSVYFSRMFRDRLGISPSQYRRQLMSTVGKDITLSREFQNRWKIVRYR